MLSSARHPAAESAEVIPTSAPDPVLSGNVERNLLVVAAALALLATLLLTSA